MALNDGRTPHEPTARGDRPVLLVLRALGLGDLLTGVPALRALRRAHPDHSMVVLAPTDLAPIPVACGADQVVHCGGLETLPEVADRVDIAVNLHGRGPRSSRRLLEHAPGRLLAFRHPDISATWDGPLWLAEDHETVRWCRLLQHHGITADPSDLRLEPPSEPSLVPPGTVVVHPGAGAAGRRWPADRFTAVVQRVLADGHMVALTGSEEEQPLCHDIARRSGRDVVDLSGRTSFDELSGVVAAAGAVICNDTGIAHLAVAHGTRSVVLFGPSPPSVWGPPAGSPLHRALWSGSVGDPHGTRLDPGLDLITVHDVMEAYHEVMAMPTATDIDLHEDRGAREETPSHARTR